MKQQIEELISGYKTRIDVANTMLKDPSITETARERLETKQGVWRTFITNLEQILREEN